MSDPYTNQELTPAAQAALESYLSDLRNEVLEESKALSASISDYPEVGVSEVLAAIRRRDRGTKDLLTYSEIRLNRLRRLTTFVITLGALVATTAATLFSLYSADFSESSTSGILLSLVGGGLALIAVSTAIVLAFASIKETRARHEEAQVEQTSVGFFLIQWGLFERSISQLMATRFGESSALAPLSKRLDLLVTSKVFNMEDTEEFRRLRNIRNEYAHGTPNGLHISPSELSNALASLKKLESKVKRAIDDPHLRW